MQFSNNSSTLHGVALQIFECGVIINGENGVGKSELALSLIDRGHKLIADDLISLEITDTQILMSGTNLSINNFMHIRGIGFIDVAKIYGKEFIQNINKLDLIIELVNDAHFPTDRLEQLKSFVNFKSHKITKFQLPIYSNRPLGILVETLVKYHKLCNAGYDSNQYFIDTHMNLLKN